MERRFLTGAISGNLWFYQNEQVSGDAIDFVRRSYKLYSEALVRLLDNCRGMFTTSRIVIKKERRFLTIISVYET